MDSGGVPNAGSVVSFTPITPYVVNVSGKTVGGRDTSCECTIVGYGIVVATRTQMTVLTAVQPMVTENGVLIRPMCELTAEMKVTPESVFVKRVVGVVRHI